MEWPEKVPDILVIPEKIMKKIFLYIMIAFLFLNCPRVYSETYESPHYIIHSDLDSRYIKNLQANIEVFYENMLSDYFSKGWDTPLDIYYSTSQSDTQKLMARFGYKDKVHYGVYIPSSNAIYTHHEMDAGGFSGIGTVFHEIVHCFVNSNYVRPPAWYNEGLATLLGEQARCVNGRMALGYPNPWREQILRNMIEDGKKINVKELVSISARQFYKKRESYHPNRALFYFIHETGNLRKYMRKVTKEGYGLDVMENALGKSRDQINSELLVFIKSNCYPAAYYQDGITARNMEDKKKFFHKSLQMKPDYYPVQFELAICYYTENNYEKCNAALTSILDDPDCKEFARANNLLSDIYYMQKEYSKAIKYSQIAWDCSGYDEYRFRIAYKIGCCYNNLGNRAKAKHWFKKYLDENWEPEKYAGQVNSAKYYQTLEVR